MKRIPALLVALPVLACFMPLTAAEEPAEEIPGFVAEREDGTFLNLRVENNNFAIYVYDKEKKEKLPVEYTHGRIQFEPSTGERRRTVLAVSEDGMKMSSPYLVRRPYVFNFWLYLFQKGNEEPAFKAIGNFNQPMPGDGESISLYDMLPPDQRP